MTFYSTSLIKDLTSEKFDSKVSVIPVSIDITPSTSFFMLAPNDASSSGFISFMITSISLLFLAEPA